MAFTYPAGHEWRVLVSNSEPGMLIWWPMQEADTGKPVLAFVLREESDVIANLPESVRGTVYLEWRFGLFGPQTDEGKTVAYLAALLKTPGGISETNVNVLHLDEETCSAIDAEEPIILILVGDSKKIERQILFPLSPDFKKMIRQALQMFRTEPWTDEEYDAVKAAFQESLPLDHAWALLGQKR